MNTEQLIAGLSRNVPSIPHHALGRRLGTGLLAGAIIAVLLVAGLLGVRPDLQSAVTTFSFWLKWAYTIPIATCAVLVLTQLARPTSASLRGLWFLAVPVLLLAGICMDELATTPTFLWLPMWLGRSSMQCLWAVLGLAVPIFLGLVWSFRRFAPSRMRAAGAAAGVASAAWSAAIYCLYCREASATFVLTWYSLPIVLAAGTGALLGPRLMRW